MLFTKNMIYIYIILSSIGDSCNWVRQDKRVQPPYQEAEDERYGQIKLDHLQPSWTVHGFIGPLWEAHVINPQFCRWALNLYWKWRCFVT